MFRGKSLDIMKSGDEFEEFEDVDEVLCIKSERFPSASPSHFRRTRNSVSGSEPNLYRVDMPFDVPSTLHMIAQCVRWRHKRIPQYMYKSARHKRCLFQTTIMLLGDSGAGKSSVANHLLNTTLASTHDNQSETRSVTEYSARTAIDELRTRGIRLNIVDTPGFNDTAGPRQNACNLWAIKKYCERNCCLKRSCFPNVILFCVKASDNRLLGDQSNLAKSLRILKDLQVIDQECPNLVLVMTHACSVGVNPYNVEKWRERLRSKAVSFQQVLKEQIGFEPLVVYVDNAIDDNDLERISCKGGSILHDGTIQPKNVFDVITKLLQDNKDELGFVTVREFYRRSSQGINFRKDETRSVSCKIAEGNELSREEEACSKLLLQNGEEWDIITNAIAQEQEKEERELQANARALEKQYEGRLLSRGESLRYSFNSVPETQTAVRMTSVSFSDPICINGSPDRRREDAEAKELPPEDEEIAFKTIIIFILSVLGIVCLASAGILGTVFLGPAAFGVAAGSATACAFLGTFAKASSSKFSKTDQNEAERTANHEEFEK